jgi:plasmid stabilization system protein ParE
VKRPLDIGPEAREDIDGAYAWYEGRRPGLGEQFIAELWKVFDRIEDSPRLYAIVYRGIRLATVRRFPFVVAYRARRDRVTILAVFHGSRGENAWKSRLP